MTTKTKRIHITPPEGALELAREMFPYASNDAEAIKALLRAAVVRAAVVRAKTEGKR